MWIENETSIPQWAFPSFMAQRCVLENAARSIVSIEHKARGTINQNKSIRPIQELIRLLHSFIIIRARSSVMTDTLNFQRNRWLLSRPTKRSSINQKIKISLITSYTWMRENIVPKTRETMLISSFVLFANYIIIIYIPFNHASTLYH